jgi:hypothetical protein
MHKKPMTYFQPWRVFLNLATKTPSLHQHIQLLRKYPNLLKCPSNALFLQELKKLDGELHVLIDETARLRIAALNREVPKIQNSVDPMDWKRVCVAVMGPPMPREGELSMQYFEKILNTTTSKKKCPYQRALTSTAHLYGGQRLIYAESIYEEDKALDLITTHICDEEIGKNLLNDASAMRADLLKNAAQKHLAEMFPVSD